MKADQVRVQTLLADTVTLLCKNGLQYQRQLKVQGLLGITLDDTEVFIVHINNLCKDKATTKEDSLPEESVGIDDGSPVVSFETAGAESGLEAFRTSNVIMQDNSQGKATNLHVVKKNRQPVAKKRTAPWRPRKPSKSPVTLPLLAPIEIKQEIKDEDKNSLDCDGRPAPGSDQFCNSGAYPARGDEETPEAAYGDVVFPGRAPADAIFPDLAEVYDTAALCGSGEGGGTGSGGGGGHSAAGSATTKAAQQSQVMEISFATSFASVADGGGDMIECLLDGGGLAADGGAGLSGRLLSETMADGARSEDDMKAFNTPKKSPTAKKGRLCLYPPPHLHNKVRAGKASRSPSHKAKKLRLERESPGSNLNDVIVNKYEGYLQHAANEGGGFQCVECDLLLKTRKGWLEHMKGAHMNRRYPCSLCGAIFKWRSSRQRHMVTCGMVPANGVPADDADDQSPIPTLELEAAMVGEGLEVVWPTATIDTDQATNDDTSAASQVGF